MITLTESIALAVLACIGGCRIASRLMSLND